jgi:hypothetical protein
VSKNLILSIVFVFAGLAMVNASSNVEIFENSRQIVLSDDCLAEAWEFGTWAGENDPYWEWYWTNAYYEQICEGQ